jgi:hypothetical protein
MRGWSSASHKSPYGCEACVDRPNAVDCTNERCLKEGSQFGTGLAHCGEWTVEAVEIVETVERTELRVGERRFAISGVRVRPYWTLRNPKGDNETLLTNPSRRALT